MFAADQALADDRSPGRSYVAFSALTHPLVLQAVEVAHSGAQMSECVAVRDVDRYLIVSYRDRDWRGRDL
jgi:hypothetical protein